MSIKEIPGWRIECDGCGEDDGSDYYAWSDFEQAKDAWRDGDGYILPDGRAFHRDCLPPEFCPLGDGDEFAHTPDEVNHGMCVECEKPIPDKEAV